jgi:alkanesulfonate monooxygenase SsuD/methylene tetrahydromethanopterin reductase-like flavin-dependent oxidoreductase (luciferase family)
MADARAVEQAGFDGIWIGDTIGRRRLFPDPFAWLSVAAAATANIELGTAILQIPLRNPVELSKRLLSLHALAQGRFTLGAGAGSNEVDFAAVGVDFSQRFRLLTEYLATIRSLCNGERVGDADLTPWPGVIGGPRIVIGAWGSGIWVPRAARDYAGWMASGSRTGYQTMADGLKRYRDAGGKRAIVSTIDIDLTGTSGPLGQPLPNEESFSLVCKPEIAAERMQRVADLGYDDILLRTQDRSPENLAAIRALVPRHTGAPIDG